MSSGSVWQNIGPSIGACCCAAVANWLKVFSGSLVDACIGSLPATPDADGAYGRAVDTHCGGCVVKTVLLVMFFVAVAVPLRRRAGVALWLWVLRLRPLGRPRSRAPSPSCLPCSSSPRVGCIGRSLGQVLCFLVLPFEMWAPRAPS